MANTGNFIYNILNVEQPKGSPIAGSPFTIPLDATAEDIVEITGGVVTEGIAQAYIDSRVVENSPTCLPDCSQGQLGVDEYPAEITKDQNTGESWHAIINQQKVCVTFIKQL